MYFNVCKRGKRKNLLRRPMTTSRHRLMAVAIATTKATAGIRMARVVSRIIEQRRQPVYKRAPLLKSEKDLHTNYMHLDNMHQDVFESKSTATKSCAKKTNTRFNQNDNMTMHLIDCTRMLYYYA